MSVVTNAPDKSLFNDIGKVEDQDNKKVQNDELYCAFALRTRRFIVLTACFAGFLSPFAINIFIPALPNVSFTLHVTQAEANLAVVVYMLGQSFSPMLWAPLSDIVGRRPVYMICFTIFFCANLGASFTDTYWLLLVLRVLQSFGASSAIAIGAGVIADVTEKSERGGFMGYYAFAQNAGPTLGPLIGGALVQRWGFQATFFFLSAMSGLFLLFIFVFLVETLRALVGNGKYKATGIHQTLYHPSVVVPQTEAMKSPLHAKNFQSSKVGFTQPLTLFQHPETCLAILAYSMVYASFYLSTASLPYLLQSVYGLNDILTGVVFLSTGFGSAFGTVFGGKILDWNYDRASQRGDIKLTRVRLGPAWIYLPAYCASLLIYGWCIDGKIHIAVPVIFQFFVGLCSTMYFVNINTLIVDLFPGKAASATAAVNIGRCLLGAVAVGVVHPLLISIGSGWTFTLGTALTFVICSLCQGAIFLRGERWLEPM